MINHHHIYFTQMFLSSPQFPLPQRLPPPDSPDSDNVNIYYFEQTIIRISEAETFSTQSPRSYC